MATILKYISSNSEALASELLENIEDVYIIDHEQMLQISLVN